MPPEATAQSPWMWLAVLFATALIANLALAYRWWLGDRKDARQIPPPPPQNGTSPWLAEREWVMRALGSLEKEDKELDKRITALSKRVRTLESE